ncbi:MAG: InlB B-repeat-containing protein [Clostridiales bacterium]|nr:InlB B-repeat-containing protein [Clostridiales bacterium]
MRKLLRYMISIAAAVTSALALFACSDKVSVTVELNDGELDCRSITVNSGSVIGIPQAPTKNGCIFDGWWTEQSGGELFDFTKPVTSDITIYAHWTESGVASVTFDLNLPTDNAVSSQTPSGLTLKAGEKFTPPTDPVCDGYLFKGWFEADGQAAATASTIINNDVTFYAQWAKLYTVSFASEIGDVPEPIKVEENTVAVLPDISIEGYTLGEWCTDSELKSFYDETQTLKNDITLYAKFYKHTALDAFYFGSVESDGYARITGIKPEMLDSIGDTLVIPDITASGEKIGRFSVLNTSGANEVDLSGIKKVVLSNTLNKSFSAALDLMENLTTVVGGRGGRDYTAYAGCVYSNEDDAYYRLCYVPKAIEGGIVPLRNDGTKIFIESDSSGASLKFDGLQIADVYAFELNGATSTRLSISIVQNINVVFIAPDDYVDEYASRYAKEFIYGVSGESGVFVFVPKSRSDDAEYIAEKTKQAIQARDDEIRRQEQEYLQGGK